MAADELLSEAIRSGLKTRFVGQKTVYQPELASTMEAARTEACRGAPEGTVVIAGEQTRGRGRLERAWLSPRGGVYLSIVLYPPAEFLPSLIMVASLAVAHAIKAVTGLKSRVKWPNDILVGEKKVSGILIEGSLQGSAVNYVIIGIGINANLRAANLADVSPVATSLSDELGKDVSRLELVKRLLLEFERLYLSLPDESVYQEWRESLVTLGRKVCARSGSTVYEGVAESVARDGSLRLRLPDGSLITVSAGDVTLRG
jgi:BirA family biotin operon repressor/biotin-[acetyl-CoA-carboxylase] ligase